MSKADIVSNHSELYPPVMAMVVAIEETIKLAPASLQPAIKMAVAERVLNIQHTAEARDVISSLYSCYSCDEKKIGGK